MYGWGKGGLGDAGWREGQGGTILSYFKEGRGEKKRLFDRSQKRVGKMVLWRRKVVIVWKRRQGKGGERGKHLWGKPGNQRTGGEGDREVFSLIYGRKNQGKGKDSSYLFIAVLGGTSHPELEGRDQILGDLQTTKKKRFFIVRKARRNPYGGGIVKKRSLPFNFERKKSVWKGRRKACEGRKKGSAERGGKVILLPLENSHKGTGKADFFFTSMEGQGEGRMVSNKLLGEALSFIYNMGVRGNICHQVLNLREWWGEKEGERSFLLKRAKEGDVGRAIFRAEKGGKKGGEGTFYSYARTRGAGGEMFRLRAGGQKGYS